MNHPSNVEKKSVDPAAQPVQGLLLLQGHLTRFVSHLVATGLSFLRALQPARGLLKFQ
jgi:hypothetical protein